MGALRPGRTVVYSGDTRPCESVLEASRGADVLIHDGSFADEMADWAQESKHSTAGKLQPSQKKPMSKNWSSLILVLAIQMTPNPS